VDHIRICVISHNEAHGHVSTETGGTRAWGREQGWGQLCTAEWAGGRMSGPPADAIEVEALLALKAGEVGRTQLLCAYYALVLERKRVLQANHTHRGAVHRCGKSNGYTENRPTIST
jgi:hypothetical protein